VPGTHEGRLHRRATLVIATDRVIDQDDGSKHPCVILDDTFMLLQLILS
jgi:hypothetical protein